MKREDQDTLLKAIDRALVPSLKVTDNVTLTPNLPFKRNELHAPVKAVTDQVALEVKIDKNTSVKVERKKRDLGLFFTKKF